MKTLAALVAALALGVVVVPSVAAGPSDESCWGQASKLYALYDGPGTMGEHASSEPLPRDGLRNLARYLADEGVIEDDSMQSLGAFVAEELGLSIDACGTDGLPE